MDKPAFGKGKTDNNLDIGIQGHSHRQIAVNSLSSS